MASGAEARFFGCAPAAEARVTLGGEGSEEGADTPPSLGSCFLTVHVPITCLDGPGISQGAYNMLPDTE